MCLWVSFENGTTCKSTWSCIKLEGKICEPACPHQDCFPCIERHADTSSYIFRSPPWRSWDPPEHQPCLLSSPVQDLLWPVSNLKRRWKLILTRLPGEYRKNTVDILDTSRLQWPVFPFCFCKTIGLSELLIERRGEENVLFSMERTSVKIRTF